MLRPILDGARHRFGVAASEVGQQDLWQSAELGFSAVASTVGPRGEVLDNVERFVWSFPEVEVELVRAPLAGDLMAPAPAGRRRSAGWAP